MLNAPLYKNKCEGECIVTLPNSKFNVIVLLSIGMSPVFFFLFPNDDFIASDATSETKLGIE